MEDERLVRVDRWRVVPDALTFDPHLSLAAKHLYCVLLTYAGSANGEAWPGLEGLRRRIAEQAQLLGQPQGFAPPSLATLKRSLAELEKRGWIARKRRRNRSTLTFITDRRGTPPPWHAQTLDSSTMSPPDSSSLSHPDSSTMSPPNSSPVSPRTRERERDPENEQVAAVAKFVYDNRPNCAHTFMALRSVARTLIAAGHSPGAVQAAMVRSATVTVNACEVELARTRQTIRRPQIVKPTAETGLVND